MPIDQAKFGKGSKAFGVATGFATGGPLGAALALLPDSSGKGAITAIKGISDKVAQDKLNDTIDTMEARAGKAVDSFQSPPEIGSSFNNDAMSRRANLDPENTIHQGIEALGHPDVPDSIRFAAAPHLFAAKHYSMQGLQPPDGYHLMGQDSQDGE